MSESRGAFFMIKNSDSIVRSVSISIPPPKSVRSPTSFREFLLESDVSCWRQS